MEKFLVNKNGVLLVEVKANSSRLCVDIANPGMVFIEASTLECKPTTQIRVWLTPNSDSISVMRCEVISNAER